MATLIDRIEADHPLDVDAEPLAAIVALSRHLATAERVLYPVARHRLPDGRARVEEQHGLASALQRTLWFTERRLTGDVRVAELEPDGLLDRLHEQIEAHDKAERDLLEQLSAVLSATEQERLAERFEQEWSHAPTRPHPSQARRPALARLAFRADAFVDRIRDALDNRTTQPPAPPLPR
jgi:hypothetical protein